MPGPDDLIGRLIAGKVDFVVIGGFAAVAHGSTLVTLDIDVCCEFSPVNLMRLQTAIADLHPVHRMTPGRLPLVLTETTCRNLKNLYLDTDYGQLDCLGAVLGLGAYLQVKKLSVRRRFSKGICKILSLPALIQAKEAMGRPRDKEAVIQLRALAERLTPPAHRRSVKT